MQLGSADAMVEIPMIRILRVDIAKGGGGHSVGFFFTHNVRAAPSSGIILNG